MLVIILVLISTFQVWLIVIFPQLKHYMAPRWNGMEKHSKCSHFPLSCLLYFENSDWFIRETKTIKCKKCHIKVDKSSELAQPETCHLIVQVLSKLCIWCNHFRQLILDIWVRKFIIWHVVVDNHLIIWVCYNINCWLLGALTKAILFWPGGWLVVFVALANFSWTPAVVSWVPYP